MVVAIAAMIVILSVTGKPQMGEFVPPPFDENAVAGDVPLTTEEKLLLSWDVQVPQGATYRTGITGVISVTDGKAVVWLQNLSTNTVNLKLRLTNAAGDVVGESGLVKPGEYLRDVALTKSVGDDEQLTIRVMSYEPETYRSEGAFLVKPTLTPPYDASVMEMAKFPLTEQQKSALDYRKVVFEGSELSVGICSNVEVEKIEGTNGGQLNVWLTTAAVENVLYKMRVTNAAGVTVSETGLIAADRFVKALPVNSLPTNNTPLILTVAAYDATTLSSLGVVQFDATVINNVTEATPAA